MAFKIDLGSLVHLCAFYYGLRILSCVDFVKILISISTNPPCFFDSLVFKYNNFVLVFVNCTYNFCHLKLYVRKFALKLKCKTGLLSKVMKLFCFFSEM